jgi:hypothetical protein
LPNANWLARQCTSQRRPLIVSADRAGEAPRFSSPQDSLFCGLIAAVRRQGDERRQD